MPSLTISRADAERLVKFVRDHGKDQFFIAKDQGAYLGYSVGAKPEQQCLFYFRGMDPSKNPDFYETARYAFGGDDFGEHLPITTIEKMLANPVVKKIRFEVTSRAIKTVGIG